MYELMIKGDFSAAHNLRNYKGKCEHLHGHNYNVEVYMEFETTDNKGLAMDFTVLKKKIFRVLEMLDHKYLNKDIKFFKQNNPSAENIAKFIFLELEKKIKVGRLKRVSVWESKDAKASYYK